MFFLKFLFVLLLIAFIIMLAYTIYTKVTNPEKPFMDCIPFMNDFQQINAKNSDAEVSDSNTRAETLKVAATETKVAENPKPDATKSNPVKAKSAVGAKKAEKKPAKSKATTTKSKASKPNAKSKAGKTKGDNIKKINGIGPVFEKKLNSIGVNKFEHIAAWTNADADRIDEELELSGRPQREDWIAKAKILAAEKNA